jgi:hypothetical protein
MGLIGNLKEMAGSKCVVCGEPAVIYWIVKGETDGEDITFCRECVIKEIPKMIGDAIADEINCEMGRNEEIRGLILDVESRIRYGCMHNVHKRNGTLEMYLEMVKKSCIDTGH